MQVICDWPLIKCNVLLTFIIPKITYLAGGPENAFIICLFRSDSVILCTIVLNLCAGICIYIKRICFYLAEKNAERKK